MKHYPVLAEQWPNKPSQLTAFDPLGILPFRGQTGF
jgi:hypothetical protein